MKAIPAPARVSGFVAIVVQPDEATVRASYALAASLMPPDATQALAPGSLPHVTLTQCAVRDAPRELLARFVTGFDARLRGLSVPLRAVTAFGGGFLFWCVDGPSPARTALQRAHEDALAVADGILDPVANAAVVAATVETTANDPVLVANAREFG
ncbi:MAG: hypothetical protein HYR51_18790, partial [Candidatus Rokubacteria bacterium]|nr:hypothetical protein [Candidatus Rokubacteria bacterium]